MTFTWHFSFMTTPPVSDNYDIISQRNSTNVNSFYLYGCDYDTTGDCDNKYPEAGLQVMTICTKQVS